MTPKGVITAGTVQLVRRSSKVRGKAARRAEKGRRRELRQALAA